MIYRIFPPIGIARLGNSSSAFFIGSESPDSSGTELQADGSEDPVSEYKTGDTGNPMSSYQVKRQAGRFRLFEFDQQDGAGRPAVLPEGSTIEWSVRLVNKKDAVTRPDSPLEAPPDSIVIADGRANRIIDSGLQSIQGLATSAVALAGSYVGHSVSLGELRTDPHGNLLVLGGAGVSGTFENAPIGEGEFGFYNNPGWHDDVADGPVTAKILLPDGSVVADIEPAWVIIAPPDFAPGVRGVVTLYDIIRQSAIRATPSLLSLPSQPSFTNDILPLIRRARGLKWVHVDAAWNSISTNLAQLADPSAAAATRRKNAVSAILTVESAFSHPDYNFKLCDWQRDYLNKYKEGNFAPDLDTPVAAHSLEPNALTRAVLDGTVGEGFYPGIEAGRILTNTDLYSSPFAFRLAHDKVNAGDLTALMALPWQADFLKCAAGWWPTQRPNQIPSAAIPRPQWARGIINHQDMVDKVMQLGVVTPRTVEGGPEVQEESRRDPALAPPDLALL